MYDLVRLVGPGGAGKTTVGGALAKRLGAPFADLDAAFTAAAGSISGYINTQGYAAYAARNVDVYVALEQMLDRRCVLAVSSGFMTYSPRAHGTYARCLAEIV